jgi:hypothetical protein
VKKLETLRQTKQGVAMAEKLWPHKERHQFKSGWKEREEMEK